MAWITTPALVSAGRNLSRSLSATEPIEVKATIGMAAISPSRLMELGFTNR